MKVKYEPLAIWVLTNCRGLKAAVLALDGDEARQLAFDLDPNGQWRTASCERIASDIRVSRVHRVLALEK